MNKNTPIVKIGITLCVLLVIIVLGLAFYYTPFCQPGFYVDGVTCVSLGDRSSKPVWTDVLDAPAYVINLDRCPERWVCASQRLVNAGYTNVMRYSGVDGRAVDLMTAWKTHCPDPTFMRPWANVGEQGCMLSWLGVLKQIAEGTSPVASVFEDDMVFHPAWSTHASTFYDETPSNYDVVFMGSQTVCVVGNTRVMRVPMYCMHAVMFTKEGAKKLYNFLTTRPIYTIDAMIYDNWNTNAFKHYIWNFKDPKYAFTGFKGLVYQDKTQFKSTINVGSESDVRNATYPSKGTV